MNFDQSGLPPIQLVEDAFNRSIAYVKSCYDEIHQDFTRQITLTHRENVMMLEQTKRQGRMSEEQYKSELAELEAIRDHQLKQGPALVNNELNKKFAREHLVPARELFKFADKASPELLAAVLLVECARSPKDFKAIEKDFGPVVGGLVEELIHIERYSARRATALPLAEPDVKRAYMVQVIVGMMSAAEQANQMIKRGRRPTFTDGHEQELLEVIKQSWGADKKLDERMTLVFNKTAELLSSKLRLKNIDGEPTLVDYVPPKPPVPPVKPTDGKNLPAVRKPPGNGSIGGDVF